MPPLALIVAVAENGVIGRDGELPWRISSDLKRFKALTVGKPVVMGRKTFESIGRPLPSRPNLVVTRDTGWRADGAEAITDIDRAFNRARMIAAEIGADEAMVIGGAALYEAALPAAQRIYLTEVRLAPEGDVRFPKLAANAWREAARETPDPGPKDEAPFSFVVLERGSAPHEADAFNPEAVWRKCISGAYEAMQEEALENGNKAS